MNKSDSERIASLLEDIGYQEASKIKEADLIVVNMCSVRQSAVDRVYGWKKIFEKIKKEKPLKTALTGCILKKDREKFKEFFDFIFSIEELSKLPKILGFEFTKDYLKIKPKYNFSPIAYVPIMRGCNNFCSFCVVPYTRGREISRPAEKVLEEVKKLVKRGAKEIWLLGQNVNSYKSQIPNPKSQTNSKIQTPNSKPIEFPQLLRMVNDIPGNFWIRFTSSHPKDFTDELIETMAECKKVTPYLNLPVQSGDDEILKKMNRPYTSKDYQKLIKKLKNAFKKYRKGQEAELAISTDIIVGFPGETEKAFENTKKLVKKIGFFLAYIAQYSPRPGTLAFSLKDNVSQKEKQKREKELTKIIKKSGKGFNQKFVGKIVNVLVLKEKEGFYFGKTRHYQTIKFLAKKPKLSGNFVKVKVKKALDFGLEGEIFS